MPRLESGDGGRDLISDEVVECMPHDAVLQVVSVTVRTDWRLSLPSRGLGDPGPALLPALVYKMSKNAVARSNNPPLHNILQYTTNPTECATEECETPPRLSVPRPFADSCDSISMTFSRCNHIVIMVRLFLAFCIRLFIQLNCVHRKRS